MPRKRIANGQDDPREFESLRTDTVHNDDREADVRVYKDGSEIVASGDSAEGEIVRDADLKNVLDKNTSGSVFDVVGGGIHVHLRAGDYGEPSGTIQIPDVTGTVLSGAGEATKITPPANDRALNVAHAYSSTNTDDSDTETGVVIEGIKFETPSSVAESDWGDAIRLQGGVRDKILGCTFKRCRIAIDVDQSTNNAEAWAPEIRNNQAEIVHRFIVVLGAHDPIVTGNHVEGVSPAKSGDLSNPVGEAWGIAFQTVTNGTVADNIVEQINDDGGEGKGYYILDHNVNLEFDNNYEEGSDRPIVVDYSRDPNGNAADMNFSSSLGVIDNRNVSWSCPNTDVDMTLSDMRGGVYNLTGSVDELYFNWTGGHAKSGDTHAIALDASDGVIEISDITAGLATGGVNIDVSNGTFSRVGISGVHADQRRAFNLTVDELSLSHGTVDGSDIRATGGGGSSISRMTINGWTQPSNGVQQLFLVDSGSSVSTLDGDGNLTGNASLVTNNGTLGTNNLEGTPNST